MVSAPNRAERRRQAKLNRRGSPNDRPIGSPPAGLVDPLAAVSASGDAPNGLPLARPRFYHFDTRNTLHPGLVLRRVPVPEIPMALPIINGLFPEGLSLHGAVRLAASLDRDPADLPWFTLEACFELVRRERALLAPSRFVAAFAYDHLLVPRMVQEKVRASGAPAGDLYELEAAAWFKADQQWTWPRPETIADLLAYADAYWAGLPNPRGCC